MTTRRSFTPSTLASASAAAVFAFTLSACGGGNGEPPPQPTAAVVDAAAPVVTITNNVTAETATGPITFTFSFNRDVGTSFTADDVGVTGGTKGAFTRLSGTAATLVVTPEANTTGTVQVSVAANSVTAATGSGNAAVSASKAFNTVIPVVRTTLVSFQETPEPRLIGFGGAEDATVVTDPTDGANKVARIVKGATAELWAGTTVAVCPGDAVARLPFSATLTKMSARVWSPVAGIPVRLKVENSANPAQSAETEASVTVASGWQTLTFDFATPAAGTAALNPAFTYDKASVFFNFGTPGAATGARTYYLDDLSFVGSSFTASCGGGAAASTVTITMDEATPPSFAGFGGAEDASIVADPAGGSNKVARVVKSAAAELWAGTTVSTRPGNEIAPIGFSATARTITVRVWSPAAGVPVRLKVENAADPAKSVETEATVTAANTWQTLTFNFANPVAGTAALDLAATYNRASIFFNFGTPGSVTGARTYFFEDLSYPARAATGGGGTATTTAINFEGTAPTFAGFGGAEDASVVTDPTDAGNKVARIVKSATAELWAGTTISTGAGNTIGRIAFANGSTTVTARVWSPVAGIPVRMKVENAADAAVSVETEATVTTASGWQTLSFNFASQAAGTTALNLAATYNRLSVFFNFGTPGATTGARTYFIDDIVYPSAASGGTGGGSASPLVFSSGYRAGGGTAQGGNWGYFSGDFANYKDTFTGGGFADSSPPVADNDQFFFIAVTTSAPTAAVGTSSGGFLGMFVTHPGLALTGQTTLAVNVGMDENFFRQASNKNVDVFVVGSTNYSNGSGGDCKVTLKGTITPTTNNMITYTLPLAGMTLVQPCNGGGFNSGVSTVAQALAQPIGAVNTQFTFPNVNTTINSGTAAAPVYATGLTRGKTEFR